MTVQEDLVFDISADTSKARREFTDLLGTVTRAMSAVYGMLGIMKSMGLGEDVDKAIGEIMRLIMMVNMLVASLNALKIAITGGASLITQVGAVVGISGTMMSMAGFMGSFAEATVGGSLYNLTMGRQR